MRPLIVLAAVLGFPAIAAEPPHCAFGAPAASNAAVPPLVVEQPLAMPTTAADPLAVQFASSAFIKHLQSAGAVVSDLGSSHGLRTVAARNSDQFMIFQLTPDGSAAVSGATVELSPEQMQRVAAENLTDLGELHGLQGYFVRSGQRFQVFYATPDHQRLIPGIMWDAAGKNLTRNQVSVVPGAVPTVEVGNAQSANPGDVSASSTRTMPLVEKAVFGLSGSASAPRLYMLIDPQCVYSIRAMQVLKPLVDSGRVQLAVVPLSVLDYEDQGQSTRSALALLSKPADSIVSAWRSGDVAGTPALEAAQRLQVNMQIARAIGLKGTPTFVWRKPDGTEGRVDGMPTSVEAILASLGS